MSGISIRLRVSHSRNDDWTTYVARTLRRAGTGERMRGSRRTFGPKPQLKACCPAPWQRRTSREEKKKSASIRRRESIGQESRESQRDRMEGREACTEALEKEREGKRRDGSGVERERPASEHEGGRQPRRRGPQRGIASRWSAHGGGGPVTNGCASGAGG